MPSPPPPPPDDALLIDTDPVTVDGATIDFGLDVGPRRSGPLIG